MANEVETIEMLKGAIDSIGENTNTAASFLTQVQTRIGTLLQQIADADSTEKIAPLVEEAQQINAKITLMSDALKAMSSDIANPVPVPVPTPESLSDIVPPATE